MFSSANVKMYNWGELYYLKHEIDLCFKSLRESLSFNESLIEAKLQELKISIEKDKYWNSAVGGESKSQYESQFYDSEKNAIITMKYLQRNSIIISAFTIFESKLRELCEMIQEKESFKIKHSDINSNAGYVEAYVIYLTKVFEVEMINSQQKWEEIKKIRFLRNILTHSMGRGIESSYIAKIKKISEIKFDENINQIYIESTQYLIALIEKMQQFFNELLGEVDLKTLKN